MSEWIIASATFGAAVIGSYVGGVMSLKAQRQKMEEDAKNQKIALEENAEISILKGALMLIPNIDTALGMLAGFQTETKGGIEINEEAAIRLAQSCKPLQDPVRGFSPTTNYVPPQYRNVYKLLAIASSKIRTTEAYWSREHLTVWSKNAKYVRMLDGFLEDSIQNHIDTMYFFHQQYKAGYLKDIWTPEELKGVQERISKIYSGCANLDKLRIMAVTDNTNAE